MTGEILTSLGLRDRMLIATKVWTQGRERGIEQMRDSMRNCPTGRMPTSLACCATNSLLAPR